MADRFYKDIEIPDLAAGVTLEPPPVGHIQVYGREKQLAWTDSDGVEHVAGQGNGVATTQLLVDGGQANTTFNQFLLRLDFGTGGASINPTGNPNP